MRPPRKFDKQAPEDAGCARFTEGLFVSGLISFGTPFLTMSFMREEKSLLHFLHITSDTGQWAFRGFVMTFLLLWFVLAVVVRSAKRRRTKPAITGHTAD